MLGDDAVQILVQLFVRMKCQRIRSAIEESTSEFEGHKINVTISVGVASESFDTLTSLDGLIRRADDALYQAKREGRNRVVVSG